MDLVDSLAKGSSYKMGIREEYKVGKKNLYVKIHTEVRGSGENALLLNISTLHLYKWTKNCYPSLNEVNLMLCFQAVFKNNLCKVGQDCHSHW